MQRGTLHHLNSEPYGSVGAQLFAATHSAVGAAVRPACGNVLYALNSGEHYLPVSRCLLTGKRAGDAAQAVPDGIACERHSLEPCG